MKTKNPIETPIFRVLLFSAMLLGVASCGNDRKIEDSTYRSQENNESKSDRDAQEKDSQFLVNAAEINLTEILLGQLAQQKSMTLDVKDLGKMMEEEHHKCLNDLIALAKKKQVLIPTSPTEKAQDVYKKLSDKSGNDFDKSYCGMMVKGHKEAIELFEKTSKETNDIDIAQWASATLPDLRMHLEHSIKCQNECEKMK